VGRRRGDFSRPELRTVNGWSIAAIIQENRKSNRRSFDSSLRSSLRMTGGFIAQISITQDESAFPMRAFETGR
jgi:hypothetical protein